MTTTNDKYSISGHETFAFRFAWIPKAVEATLSDTRLLLDDDQAMVRLGVGKNMVRSIRFWVIAAGLIKRRGDDGYELTDIGRHLFHPEDGLDPFLEDDQTLWLLHWQLANAERRLFAWDFLLNHWHEPELVPSAIVTAAKRLLAEKGQPTSDSSLRGHLSAFFHTYYPTRNKKGDVLEAGLDCPLVQLELLEYRGERHPGQGKSESAFAFRRGRKWEISDALFCYTLADFWRRSAAAEETLSFREVTTQRGSPGLALKLDDQEVRERLERIDGVSAGILSCVASALVQSIHRNRALDPEVMQILRERIYQ